MSEASYDPVFGQEKAPAQIPPLSAENYALALAMHAGRYQVIPRIVTVTSPAPGADWSVTVPPGFVWKVRAIRALLTTSGMVGFRVPHLQYTDTNAVYFEAEVNTALSNSAALVVSAYSSAPTTSSAAQVVEIALPAEPIPILGSHKIQMATTGILTGDQWSAIALYVISIRHATPNERTQYARMLMNGEDPDPYPGFLIGG